MSFIEEIKDKITLDAVTGYRVLLCSDKGVCVEGHRGVYEISDETIRIRVKNGSVSVCGHSLKIKEISDSEIYIIGIIKGISL
ncbi:MAG: YabP/YqfC family sporulation protein [Christensenellales bacterium]|jgi:sporulation protein YqfC